MGVRVVVANPNKAKGDRAERAVLSWLHRRGFASAFKTRAGWDDDRGDIVIPRGPFARAVVQVKDVASPLWSKWHAQVADQVSNAEAEVGVIIHKRRGIADPGQWNVVLTGDQFLDLLARVGYVREHIQQVDTED